MSGAAPAILCLAFPVSHPLSSAKVLENWRRSTEGLLKAARGLQYMNCEKLKKLCLFNLENKLSSSSSLQLPESRL